MRLSDYENEEALDLLADLIEPAARIMKDKKVEAMVRAKEPGISIAVYILKNHKESAIEIVASLHRETPETYSFNALSLVNDILDILNDPEIENLFSSQEQTSTSSGSATENTGESEQ